MTPERTLSVGELAELLDAALEMAAPYGVWVAGEIAGITRPRSGHVYFDLVEPGEAPGTGPKAKVSVVLFRRVKDDVNAAVKSYGNSMRMTAGVQVRVFGRLAYFAPMGQLQLQMSAIDPAYTLARIAADRDIVLRKLAEEGVLRLNATRPVPAVPLRVGLVTSRSSAAHADAMRMLSDSGFAFTVLEADVRVQGKHAPGAIAAAIRAVAGLADVVVLTRGGGSKTDLVAFDHESVARAVALCPRPVFTGIGHEIDRSAADGAAHTACATPTAAAEAVVGVVEDWLTRLDATAGSIAARGSRLLDAADRGLDQTAAGCSRSARGAVGRAEGALAAAGRRLAGAGRAAEQQARFRLDRDAARLSAAGSLGVRDAERRLASVAARVRSLDPAAMLGRGWSIARRADGRAVRSVDDVAAGDLIVTRVADGTLKGIVLDRTLEPPASAAAADSTP